MIKEEILFNIPYWKIQTINFEEKKKKLVKFLESYPEERKHQHRNWTMRQEFATNRQINRSGLVEKFTSIMNEEVKAFSQEIKQDFAIHEIWSISYEKGDYHAPHNHSSWGLTGILYLDLPKDSPVTIYIQPWQNLENDNMSSREIPIVEGDIVIVPSFIIHFTKPNKLNSKKRIISWDMKMLENQPSSGMIPVLKTQPNPALFK